MSVALPCFSSLSNVFLSCSILHSAIGTGFMCHLPTWQWLFPIVVITLWQSSFGTTALPFSILLYLLLLITFKCLVPSWCYYSVIIPRNLIVLFLRLKELSFLWSEIILLSSGIFESLPAFSFVENGSVRYRTHEPTHSDEKQANNPQHLRYTSMYTRIADMTVANRAPLITRYFSCVIFLLSHTVLILSTGIDGLLLFQTLQS